ncbi:SWI/SNF-RELATED MATRIX-ASSOCIATED ACTIN-DEPENDENT REGULATOR OF CHROMATIN SUBFAMILY D [Salix koriyanagi]|uniref:SWI/SNF-RELATED MATRIX-ASSOCIATED ACTIN-DEPENDENT REGULATOR OF CHROMATIN SUBFAMILY D n=1 Tax=Salix koriyanagi TaxID=2511006 RepID=A0A9Q0SLD2_9ROSI|nr:SWI/SNF-RELATED MATRIX-ASSOCIATED ACTIN-DEPENDENT REGULATOR OF CHROMATIN SUBFAMILY D [Salix koriyanagi]
MVSDSELIERMKEFLRNADLDKTTTGTVRRMLEEDFAIDLSDKKAFIREQVDLFLQNEFDNDQKNGDNDYTPEDQTVNGETDGCDLQAEQDDEDEDEEKSDVKGGYNESENGGRKRGGGLSKLCCLSPQLQEFIGVRQLARTEVVKQLWSYIREKNLQDPSDRRHINCDEPLQALFGVASINMFQMNKALSRHIWPLDSENVVSINSKQHEKQHKREWEEEEDESNKKEKKQKRGNSGFLAPLQLSDALIKFLGTGESTLSRSDVVKRMWEYIKQNNLQDPSDKRRVLCDLKLKELLDIDSFTGFTVPKLISAHFLKA